MIILDFIFQFTRKDSQPDFKSKCMTSDIQSQPITGILGKHTYNPVFITKSSVSEWFTVLIIEYLAVTSVFVTLKPIYDNRENVLS